MLMPKATVNFNHSSIAWKNNVGPSRQFRRVKSEPEAVPMQISANKDFRFRMLTADAGHHSAAGLTVYDVSHQTAHAVLHYLHFLALFDRGL
jgi:hypothetical protein